MTLATSTDDQAIRWLTDLLAMLPPMTADAFKDVVGDRRLDPALVSEEVEKHGADWWAVAVGRPERSLPVPPQRQSGPMPPSPHACSAG